jgi:hypothetical protein
MIAILSLLTVAMQQSPSIMNYDPPAADTWVQSSVFSCNGNELVVEGYGTVRPHTRQVRISIRGQPLTGASIQRLRTDLSDRRAVYRIGARCDKRNGNIGLSIHKGVKDASGNVAFSAGSALISNQGLADYRGLQTSNAETFWFR